MANPTPRLWNRDAVYCLLEYGRKQGGPWDDEELWPEDNSLNMPDEYDADLVTSAPDLLEALSELYDMLFDANDRERICTFEMQAKAKAALLKARGKKK